MSTGLYMSLGQDNNNSLKTTGVAQDAVHEVPEELAEEDSPKRRPQRIYESHIRIVPM